MTPLVITTLHKDADVIEARRRTRHLAERLELDIHERTRIITLVSEVARDLVLSGGGTLSVSVGDRDAGAEVAIHASTSKPSAVLELGANASRLADHVSTDGDDTHVFRLHLPRVNLPYPAAVAALEAELRPPEFTVDLLDDLLHQNRELLSTLDELEASRAEQERVNAELAETNLGVIAMYDELSAELDRTNRGVVALYADLDQQARDLLSANETKTRFLNAVSHELRTPVNSIIALANLLLERADGPLSSEQERQATYILRSATELLDAVNDLLDLARGEAGALIVRVEPVDVRALVTTAVQLIEPLINSNSVTLNTTVAATVPAKFNTDPAIVAHILRNLMANAAKYTPSGTIEVTVDRAEDGGLALSVTDTGVGIAAQDLTHVFDEFFRADSARTMASGTGLGLALAQQLARRLGTEITAASIPGHGSTFAVTLPVRPRPGQHSPPQHPSG